MMGRSGGGERLPIPSRAPGFTFHDRVGSAIISASAAAHGERGLSGGGGSQKERQMTAFTSPAALATAASASPRHMRKASTTTVSRQGGWSRGHTRRLAVVPKPFPPLRVDLSLAVLGNVLVLVIDPPLPLQFCAPQIVVLNPPTPSLCPQDSAVTPPRPAMFLEAHRKARSPLLLSPPRAMLSPR